MMDYKIRISSFAIRDVQDAYSWYEKQRVGLGEELLYELGIAYKHIANHPQFYGFIDDRKVLRDLLINRFPYLVVYKITGEIIHVIAVHHAKKHPSKKYGDNG